MAALDHFTSEGRLQGALSGCDYEVALHAFTCATLALLRATLALLRATMRATRIFGQRLAGPLALSCVAMNLSPKFWFNFKCEAVPAAPQS